MELWTESIIKANTVEYFAPKIERQIKEKACQRHPLHSSRLKVSHFTHQYYELGSPAALIIFVQLQAIHTNRIATQIATQKSNTEK